jgi:hypothetical protein
MTNKRSRRSGAGREDHPTVAAGRRGRDMLTSVVTEQLEHTRSLVCGLPSIIGILCDRLAH